MIELPRVRTALAAAEAALIDLEASYANAAEFALRFPGRLGEIRVFGSALKDAVARLHRTREFDEWWAKAATDPVVQFVKEVRDSAFKKRETRASRKTLEAITSPVDLSDEVTWTMAREDGSVTTGHSAPTARRSREPTPPAVTIEWVFVGGAYDGHDVLGVLRDYLRWARETLARAEAGCTS